MDEIEKLPEIPGAHPDESRPPEKEEWREITMSPFWMIFYYMIFQTIFLFGIGFGMELRDRELVKLKNANSSIRSTKKIISREIIDEEFKDEEILQIEEKLQDTPEREEIQERPIPPEAPGFPLLQELSDQFIDNWSSWTNWRHSTEVSS